MLLALFASFWVSTAFASGSGPDDEPDFEEADEIDTPDEPDEPDLPDQPDEPDEPDVPDEPGELDEPDGPDELSDSSGPGSGDDEDDSESNSGSSDDDSSGSSNDDDSSNSGGSDSSGRGSGSDDDSSGSSNNSGSGNSGSDNSGSGNSETAAIQPEAYDAVALERDETGDERVAGEALFTAQPDEIASAARAGFGVISDTQLTALDRRIARLRLPDGVSVELAINILESLAPDAVVAANGVYRSSQSGVSGNRPAQRGGRAATAGQLGIIDTGVDPAALSTPAAVLSQRAFAAPAPVAREHGTLVAALAVDRGIRVHIADVFRTDAAGRPFASTESIAAALDWLISANVPVINISIEGPNNALLGALIARAAERGQIIVAAAGNGGPLARPSFPAAFEGSVAVTAIDENDHPYMRANRGPYIAFAAPGVDLNVRNGANEVVVSGTSFAAPIVAVRIAQQMGAPSPANARAVLSGLQRQAIDLGEPGRDPIFGWGAIRD